MTTVRYEHIKLESGKKAVIGDTGMKVSYLVSMQIAYGWSAEELGIQFPHVSLGQIYAALAYYFDNKDAVEAEIRDELVLMTKMLREYEPSLFIIRLKSKLDYAKSYINLL
jgi:uncharacterized protein (DUF433 family)